MIDDRQHGYLDAMGIEVWKLRGVTAETQDISHVSPALKLGPGSGGTLLICAADGDSAGKLASDIVRCLGENPVWAWPDEKSGESTLEEAVERHLFTTVAVFGSELAARFFKDQPPLSVLTSQLVLLPGMRELETRAAARRNLWAILCRSGMVNIGRVRI